jgi:hypothetical protein
LAAASADNSIESLCDLAVEVADQQVSTPIHQIRRSNNNNNQQKSSSRLNDIPIVGKAFLYFICFIVISNYYHFCVGQAATNRQSAVSSGSVADTEQLRDLVAGFEAQNQFLNQEILGEFFTFMFLCILIVIDLLNYSNFVIYRFTSNSEKS